MRSIIIGLGEVGTAIKEVFEEAHGYGFYDDWAGVDKDGSFGNLEKPFDVMHVCIPYSKNFKKIVLEYKEKFKPQYTIIHSTVPVGTSTDLIALHSPIRGIHPKLKDGVKTFPKFIGGPTASELADYFRKANIKVIIFDNPETTEALKLFDTEYYRTCIEFAHRVKKYCDKHGLNFSEVYTIPNMTYNEGYTKLDHPEYVRPVLQPIMTKIGGHCLLPNKELIKLNE